MLEHPLILTRDLDSPLGTLRLTAVGGALTRLDFLDPVTSRPTPDETLDCDCLSEAVWQLQRYFQNPVVGFDLPLTPWGTRFQQRVWTALQTILPGTTWRYGVLAAHLGTSPRAVGRACGANPLPILIPCHRVVGVLGLTGYSGGGPGEGLAIKRWLLNHESPPPLPLRERELGGVRGLNDYSI